MTDMKRIAIIVLAIIFSTMAYSQESPGHILLEKTDGTLFYWPKNVYPKFSFIGVSSSQGSYTKYSIVVKSKKGEVLIPITTASYYKMVKEMGIRFQ
jgi:hypothetical protein